MELWIRSQDKRRLMKVDEIWVNKAGTIFCNNTIYAGYSEKRALEVLDEIQTHLLKMGKTEMLTNENGIINGIKDYGIVYKMPKE